MAVSVSSSVCSICGKPLKQEGDCLACLLRGGLDENEEEQLLSDSLVFGDFEIERRDDGSLWELGRGAMGVTYRARDKTLHRPVALKVIEVSTNAESAHATRERFLREARAAAALRHGNVASVFQFGASTEGDRYYYAMELLDGETLEALVRRDGPLSVATALEIAIQVARALVAAAAHGLIHRDLKPANIMLIPNESETSGLTAKVIDFGLAKVTTGALNETDLTQGAFVGTPNFSSPEQLAGRPADARSDIYSLGVTFWYALTGEIPWPGKTVEEIRRAQSEVTLPIGELTARKVPAPVIKLLRRTLANDSAERPQSARALLEALQLCAAETKAAPRRRRAALVFALVAISVIGLTSYLRYRQPGAAALPSEKSIAVLPFQNRSPDQASDYFAEGTQDEILTRLARIADLKVIAPASTKKYQSRPDNLRTVAAELGVHTVLEGSVQKVGGKVHVTVQLIEASSDRELWAGTYDRSLEDVFVVQSEIAEQVATALHASLTPQESLALQSVPTHNQKAYDLFLRGEHFLRIGRANFRAADVVRASQFYHQAVAEDTQFALAYARLSFAESFLGWIGVDLAGDPPDQIRLYAEKATALQPNLMEAHLALGFCDFWGRLDYPGALEHLTRAQALAPQSAEVLSALGAVYRRQLRLDESIAIYERALLYDPGNSKLIDDLATTYWWAGRFGMVPPTSERALVIDPDNQGTVRRLARFYLVRYGDIGRARGMLQSRDPRNKIFLAWTYSLTRDYEKAIHLIEEIPTDSAAFAPADESKDELLGLYHHAADHEAEASALLQPVRDRRIAVLADKTLSSRRISFNSIRLARLEVILGNFDAAIEIAERGAQCDAITRDPIQATSYRNDMAEIYARAGRNNEAIALLARQLKGPPVAIDVTPAMLRLDPRWDMLRQDPRFQKLLAEYPATPLTSN